MTRTHAWTPERVETLKRLWAEGQSCSQIAAALKEGCTRNAVIGKIHRLGLPERLKPARMVRRYAGPKAPRLSRTPAARPVAVKPEGPPRSPPPAVIAIAPSLSVSLIALGFNACRWPTGGDRADTTFCGHPAVPGQSYCSGHCAAAYTAPRRPVYAPGHGRSQASRARWAADLGIAA